MAFGDIGQYFSTGEEAAGAASGAAEGVASVEDLALENFIRSQAQPDIYRRGALNMLAQAYGGGEGQQQIIESAMASPLYGSLMGGRKAGEEAILRSASATGGLRSGNVQGAMYDYNTQLQNQALLEAYNQQIGGLKGFAGMRDPSESIYQKTVAPAYTRGEGEIAAATARQAGQQQGWENLIGLGNLALSAYDSGMFSDRRLKQNIKLIGTEKGHNIYSWEWNSIANKLGLIGKTIGCLAEEVYSKNKKDVVMKDGWMFVLYKNLGIIPGGA
jgi:hypothetical protein